MNMWKDSGLPLTPIQRGMVFHQLVDQHNGVDVEQIVVRLHEPVDRSRLCEAWCLVVARHPVLRSRIAESAFGEYELVVDPQFSLPLACVEISGSEPGALLEAWLAQDRAEGFDILEKVPLRVALLHQAGLITHCVWSFHHVLLDGRSFGDVLLDVWDTYDALVAGGTPVVPERPGTMPFLAWLRERDHSQSLTYWQELLAGTPQSSSFALADPTAAGPVALERRLDTDLTASIGQWTSAWDVTLGSLLQAGWATLLARYTDQDTVVFGSARAGRAGHVPDCARMLGVFINTVPVRAGVGQCTGIELVRALRRQQLDARPHEHVPLAQIQQAAGVAGDLALFQSLLVFDHETLDASVHRQRPGWTGRSFELHERTPYPVTLYAYAGTRLTLRLACNDNAFSPEHAARVLDHLIAILGGIVAEPTTQVRQMPMLTDDERRLIHFQWNDTHRPVEPTTIQAAFERAVAAHPQRPALTGAGRTLSYAQLNRAAENVATRLAESGVVPGNVVGLSLDRSLELVIGMLGILKAGAAYLPLDPDYPAVRLDYCVRDSAVAMVLTQRRHAHRFQHDGVQAVLVEDIIAGEPKPSAHSPGAPQDVAYTIYTSGSTGNPKGVQVTHANVVNFFAGMDAVVDVGAEKRWLAVTSASFDISVLELLWTLTRGFEVIVHGARDLSAGDGRRGPSFSLFHFASGMDAADPEPYRLIIEAAKFADRNGLEAVWSPERHFHDFGAPYPSPAVMNAALATITSRVALRAGSVVLPLHDPVRVVEEWSLVDRLSHGRVGVSFASGWQPNDFVLAPANYERRKELMFEQIETVRALWRGERIPARNPRGDQFQLGTYPRPVQAQLPVWITAAGNPETFQQAGAVGANLLTHMLGQTPADLAANIHLYRQARAAQGLDPATGRVTAMVHTFIGDDTDEVRELVREPMKRYLRSAASLVGNYADAWSAYKRGSGSHVAATAMSELSTAELAELYDFAFERYFESSGLFGSVDKCAPLVEALQEAGVDEIACLIDFGVEAGMVIEHLPYIARLRDLVSRRAEESEDDIVRDIDRHRISHLQCTPSQARTIPMLAGTPATLRSLRQVLIGGETLPVDLVETLYRLLAEDAAIFNMYGPTETTIWSTCERVARQDRHITIGRPLANTRCYALDSHRRSVPPGCVGELHIAGAGVARGYLGREQLTAERFFDLTLDGQVQRVYATGDRVRYTTDGRIEYQGRNDGQVKVRGHRVELGEIEIALRAEACVADAAVVTREDSVGSQQLVGYVVAERGTAPPVGETLKAALRQRLPEHMVPSVVVWLDALPLTPNGKIDRRALSTPLRTQVSEVSASTASPDSETMSIIREIWQRVLNLPHIGPRDNFFALGGHSILAVKAQSELSQAFGHRLPITELFRSPTIESLALRFASDAPSETIASTVLAADKARKRRAAMSRRVAKEKQGQGP